MKWNRISVKLGAIIITLFLLVLLPLGFVINQILSGFFHQQLEEETSQLSSHYASLIENNQDDMIVPMIQRMAELSQIPMYITNAEGEVIALAHLAGVEEGQLITQEEMTELLAGRTVESLYEDPEGQSYYAIGTPFFSENSFEGSVFVLSTMEGLEQSLLQVRNLLLLSGAGAFFLALGFTIVVSKKLSTPLLQMEKATRKIAKGEWETTVPQNSGDEIGSLANAINELASDLKRYRDTRREFFANISHELKTPITYLNGYSKVLKEGLYQTEKEKNEYLDIIQGESQRLSQLINDISDLSQAEEGKISLELEWVDLSEVLEGVIRKTALKAKVKGLDIHLKIDNHLPLIYGDGLRLEQIFLNLVENAIRYTDKGFISLSTLKSDKQNVIIQVEDSGKGISKKDLPYIFDRFYRVEKSRARQYGGTGLGLAIVKNLVELHNGNIEVSSQLGKGTVIIVAFPINRREKRDEGF
ncbi:ATP-binding protein [Thalassorhabdus alkalitolerans]|uniref:histidine kinase n=1 Tax=Thalassorhabdus alkalitolerans TaxID=2282697 RepID=A0ABW0YJL9_9BACI